MKKVVERERNKTYYRVLHVPIWIWVFFILPGHLTMELFLHGPNLQHGIWLSVVTVVCAWRGLAGRLPGVEPKPYIIYWGTPSPNLWYRVVCYTAAWIDLLVPYTLNLVGLAVASFTGKWILPDLFLYAYYPIASLIVLATVFDITPRARRSTLDEGAERAWFYVAIWTVVPTQVVAWAAWRLAGVVGITDPIALARVRFAAFLLVGGAVLLLGIKGLLPRTARYYASRGDANPNEGQAMTL